MNPRSGRTIPLYFKVSPEEKAIIEKKMEQLGTHNQRAYLRKMAVDGYVVRVDMTDVKELAALLRTCSNNLNQIAKRVNSIRTPNRKKAPAMIFKTIPENRQKNRANATSRVRIRVTGNSASFIKIFSISDTSLNNTCR